jgi:general secretion pathway protein I
MKFGRQIRNQAFTLAEVLAALVFVAVLIPVAIEGLHIASSVGEVAARKGEAAIVAERVLNESIVTTNWNGSAQSGIVRQGPREFPWELRNEPWTQDPNQNTMRLVTVQVKYSIQGRDRTFTLTTLAENPATGMAASTK